MTIKLKCYRWISTSLFLAILLLSMPLPVMAAAPAQAGAHPTPVLAYYYLWFTPSSWDRAKIDIPLLGKYSSDDRSVMLQHILWAKAAGINGFIVSWKSTDVLNHRLDQLAGLAEQQNFKLIVIYEGLDFQRNPLPVDQVAGDLDYFIQHFASRPAFQVFSKPGVILSGTWKFTTEEISQIIGNRRSSLLLLASERNLDGYKRLADMVDGDAYYWSSVNPDTNQGYADKLVGMSALVHQFGGLWIPPAAPGFDARLIGGTTVVDRKDGQTFRSQINTAMSSSPDALGIISWNEFSENSYIEPSKTYGSQYLDILSTINNMPSPTVGDFDSSEPAAVFNDILPWSRTIALGSLIAVIVTGIIIISRRKP